MMLADEASWASLGVLVAEEPSWESLVAKELNRESWELSVNNTLPRYIHTNLQESTFKPHWIHTNLYIFFTQGVFFTGMGLITQPLDLDWAEKAACPSKCLSRN